MLTQTLSESLEVIWIYTIAHADTLSNLLYDQVSWMFTKTVNPTTVENNVEMSLFKISEDDDYLDDEEFVHI